MRKDGAQGKSYDVRCEKENTEVVGQTQTIGAGWNVTELGVEMMIQYLKPET